ncbi:hypothetical protein R5O87_11525 [Arthrobacter globiformis]|uniref:hypothetical protein n=1 Tax=Arthrobacter globiformis TaxID=1665 RepID=UPI00397B38DF
MVHLTSRDGARAVRRKNVCGHRLPLPEEEIFEGRFVACTSPLRTWFDLAGILSLQDLVIAGDFLLRRRDPLSKTEAMDAFLAEKQGRAGYPKAMKAMALIRANTDSPKETELRLLLVAAGLPEPAINVPMLDHQGTQGANEPWLEVCPLAFEDSPLKTPSLIYQKRPLGRQPSDPFR